MSDSKEDRLAKKGLSERRRKARIKSDPELYAVHKEKDRQRYYKRKNEGKIKSVSELDPRQQGIFREGSRIYSNKHNLKRRRKEMRCLEEDLVIVPEVTDKTDDPLVTSQSQTVLQTEASSYVALLPSSSSVVSFPLPQRIKAYRGSSAPLSPPSDVSKISKLCTRSSVRVIEKEFPPTPKANKKLNTKVIICRLKYRMNKIYQLQKEKIDELKTVNERQRKQIYRLKYQSAKLREYEYISKNNTEDIKQSESDTIKTIVCVLGRKSSLPRKRIKN
ncbi:unnamed protein product [Parnassius apollo]|uniref:(apollo) hypothetical protein n=1 Tax=Parnassius apollo TaxID=110799 RepID=A0A8S3WS70_PARAO|nr:unnamed protein product [Parnassius apollo]